MAWETTAVGVDAVGFGVVALADEQRVRDGVVVEAGDVPELEGQIGGGLAVGRVEGAVLGRMLVGPHAHVEGSLDGGDGAFDLDVHAVAGAADDGEAVRSSRSEQRRHSPPGVGPKRAVNSGTVRKWR